jgi:hypothetical protein
MTPWRWVWRALGTGLFLLVAGWGLGGLLGLWSPLVSMAVCATAALLVAAPWSVERIGGAGLGASLVALIGALGAGVEVHHASLVSRVTVVQLPSLAAWSPESDVVAMEVPPVHGEPALAASVSFTVRSGKGTRTVNQTAVPLAEAQGRIVAFACGTQRDVAGRWALSAKAWEGKEPEACETAIVLAVANARRADREVEPSARSRVVRVYPTLEALRSAHELRLAIVMPLVFFGVYAFCVVVFRKHRPVSGASGAPTAAATRRSSASTSRRHRTASRR